LIVIVKGGTENLVEYVKNFKKLIEMKTFNLDITSIQDFYSYGSTTVIDEIMNFINSEVKQGNIIIIEKRYTNAKTDIIMQITTIEQLEQFKKQYLFH
jgi:hypothetical protein